MNNKHKCQCGAVAIWKENAIAPSKCHWCGLAILEAKAKKVAFKRIRSIYTGYDTVSIKGATKAFLGSGVTRKVWDLGDGQVVKIGSPVANETEVIRWVTAIPELRKGLCPVIDWADNYEWIIMRKADTHAHANLWDLPEVARRNIADLHGGNIAMLDGRPVVIDYADGFAGQKAKEWPEHLKVAVAA